MSLVSNIIINSFSILLILIILVHCNKNVEKNSLQNRLYVLMVQLTMLLLVLDILGRFDGKPDTFYTLFNHTGNFLIFLLNPVLPSMWLLYVHYQIYHDLNKMKRILYPLLALNVINAGVVILSQFNGFLYHIDAGNIYHRGPFFFLSWGMTALLILIAFILVMKNKGRIEKKYYYSLLFFGVPPFAGVILQIQIYGISLSLNCVVLSLLIVLLDIHDTNMYTDYLTGISNRQKLENALQRKVEMSNSRNSFSLIMMDIDNFKIINDTFGHDAGDIALKSAAAVLKSCLRAMDFVARFGGDEFYYILDISDKKNLDAAVSRINRSIDAFNRTSDLPYKLSFSMGYAVYDHNSNMKANEFMKYVDMLMYQDKKNKKQETAELRYTAASS